MSKAAELVIELRTRGVEITADASGGISYRGPRGAVSPDLRGQLVMQRSAVVELLQTEGRFLAGYRRLVELRDRAEDLERRGNLEGALQHFRELGDLVEGSLLQGEAWSPDEMKLRGMAGHLWPEYWATIPQAVQRELVSVA